MFSNMLMSDNQFTGVLDSYTTGLWSAWSMEKRLIGTYGLGPAINVRRDSDNATTDINLTAAGGLDTTALATFAGSASCYVTTAYDQSGAGNHWYQATAANQPRIVNAGVYDGTLVFAPTGTVGSWLATANNSGAVQAKTICRKYNVRSGSTGRQFVYGNSSSLNNLVFLSSAASPNNNTCRLYADGGGSNYQTGIYNSTSTSNVVDTIVIKKSQTLPNEFYWYQSGVAQTPIFFTTVGSGTYTGNFVAKPWILGVDTANPTTTFGLINYNTVAVYDSDQTANAASINTALT